MALIENLTSYWALDSNFYDTIGDVHGEGYNTTFSAGKIRVCVDLNGVDSYCVFGPNEDLYLTQPFTYTFWVNAPEVPSDSVYLDLNGESGIKMVRSSLDGKVTVTVSGSGNNLVSSQRIDNGVWNFVCIIIDGAESKFYLNTTDITGSCSVISGPEYNNAPLYLGASNSGTNYTEMSIDEFGVWNKALTVNDIDYLYNEGIGSSVGLNNGLYFNGTSDYAEFPVPTMTSGTLECWVELKDSSVGSYIGILELGSWGNSTGFGIWIENSTNSIGIHDSRVTHTYSSEKIIVDQNIHLAAVYNSTDIFLYLNGDLIHTISSASVNSADVITIGKRADASTDQFFNGNISEIRVWDYPRTQQDVRDYMFIPPDVGDSGLISYYDFKEGLLGDNVLSFDGSDDCVEIFSNLDVYNNFVMEFIASPNVIIELPIQTNTGNQGTGTNINPIINASNAGVDGRSDCGVSVGTNGVVIIEHADGFWNFPLVWNGTVTDMTFISIKYENNTPNLYVDGVFKKQGLTSSKSKIYPGILNRIGGHSYGYYSGSGNEFRLWDRVLTDQEIQDNVTLNMIGNELGLVAYYKLDEGTGTTAIDSAGGNDGLINGPVWARNFYNHNSTISGTIYGASFAKNTGWFNISQDVFYNNINSSDKGYVDISYLSNYYESLLYYNGINHYIEFPRLLDSLTWTVELRIWPDDYPPNATIFQQYSGSDSARTICGQRGNTIDIFQNGTWTVGTTDISTLGSFYLSVVCDSGDLTMYIDGEIELTRTGFLVPQDVPFLLAGDWYYFKGSHEELRVWSIARTQQQIQDNMDSTLSGTESGLLGYWKLNENEGSIAYDSADSNDGTIHGSVWRRIRASEEHVLSLEEPFTFNTLKYDLLNLELFPDEGCTTSGILINEESLQLPEVAEPYLFHTINSIEQDSDIQINFRDLYQYTIEAISYGSGILNPSGTLTYYEFDTPTFSFIPDEGYRLLNYSIDGISKSNNDFSYTFSSLIDGHTVQALFGTVDEYDGLVVTTELIKLNNSSTTLVSGSLSKGQDINQCVPFVSNRGSSNNLSSHFTDVYFYNGEVFIETDLTSANSTVNINVIEFNPSSIEVIQGNFEFSGTTLDVTISSIDPNHSFLIFCYKSTSGGYDWRSGCVRGIITDETTISFYRNVSTGTITGHYYVVKSLDKNFYVQHLTHTAASAFVELPNPVEPHRTFIIMSNTANSHYDDPEKATACISLENGKSIYYNKVSGSYSIYAGIQVVEFAEKGKVFVNHGKQYVLGAGSDYELTGKFPSQMHGVKVMVHNPSSNQGLTKSNGTYGDVDSAFATVEYLTSDEFKIIRNDRNYTMYMHLQFIDWEGYTMVSGISSPPCSDLVRSVESIPITLESEKHEYYKYLPLTKDQNWKNCVPFCTYTSTSTSHEDTRCSINISEGNILTIHRDRGYAVDCDLYIYIVEFDPSVYIEKGEFFTQSTDCYVSVSGTTSSGVYDLDKTLLHFTQNPRSVGYRHDASNVRGYFTSNNNLRFYRYNSLSSVFGYYYVIEFPNDSNILINHKSFTSEFYEEISKDTAWEINKTIPILTYSSTSTYDDPEESTIYYNHQFPQRGYISRAVSSYSVTVDLFLLRFNFNDQIPVQKVYFDMGTTTLSGSVDLDYEVDFSTSMVLNNNQQGVTSTPGTYTQNVPGAYVVSWISDDGKKVNYRRRSTGSGVNSRSFLYVVDWSKTNKKETTINSLYKGLVKSIETLEFDIDYDYKEVLLTKNQNTSQCIPFCMYNSVDTTYNRMFFMVDINESAVSLYRNWWTSSPTFCICNVIEFNPRHANVKKYYFTLTGDVLLINIDSVNKDKTFIVISSASNAANTPSQHYIRGIVVDSTTIEIKRGSSGYNVWGIVYVVECLDDSFEVSHLSDGNNMNFNSGSVVSDGKTLPIVSYYATSNYDDPDETTVSLFYSKDRSYVLERYVGSYSIYGSLQHIKFNKYINKVGFLSKYFNSSTVSHVVELGAHFTNEMSFIMSPIYSGISKTAGPYNHYLRGGFFIAEFLESGTEIEIKRGTTAAINSEPSFNVIEFIPPYKYYFEGIVKEKNIPVDRVVALYRRSTNELIDSTTSSGTAGYRLESPYGDEHYIVCLDDEASPDFNALIEDRIIGELIPNM